MATFAMVATTKGRSGKNKPLLCTKIWDDDNWAYGKASRPFAFLVAIIAILAKTTWPQAHRRVGRTAIGASVELG